MLIPVYNERALVEACVRRVLGTPRPIDPATGAPIERTVLLVDDGSTDGSATVVRELAREPGVEALLHERNLGKGAAVRTGIAHATREGPSRADVILIHDADLEYDPADHAAMVAPILDGRADAVIGSRFLGSTHRVLYFWHSIANRFITLCSNMLSNLNLTDIECCLKAMRADVAARLGLREPRFGIEPEIVAKLAAMRLDEGASPRALRIYEVAVSYAGRTYAEGKKIGWKDGFAALACIVKYSF